MNIIFLKILNMSISASWLILATLILRIILKKTPKWGNVLLWGIVAIRLICPFYVESEWSLIPNAETIPMNIEMDTTPTIHTGIYMLNKVVNPIISQVNVPINGTSINPLQITIAIFWNMWILGIVVLLIFTVFSYWRLRRMVHTAVLYKEHIFQSEYIMTPFVLGILKPRIYLPFKLEKQYLEYVIAHEQAHIRRKDHWWKAFGFLLRTIYWFNPLVWLAYVLLCHDIELACDEKVIKEFDNEQRANYTQALVTCSVKHRIISTCPLAFGEVGVKERIKNVMNYKNPTFLSIILSVIVGIIVATCFLTNPATKIKKIGEVNYFVDEINWDEEITIEIPEFPRVTFHYTAEQIIASNFLEKTEEILIWGMPIWNAYFCDLTGDGLPEICTSASWGSGMIDERIIVYDYAHHASYELSDRGKYNYYLRLNNEDGYLYVDKKDYTTNPFDSYSNNPISSGRLIFKDGEIQIEEVSSQS